MPVPVRVMFKGNQMRRFNMLVKKKEQSFTLEFPMKCKKIQFNPDFAVLAQVKKKSF